MLKSFASNISYDNINNATTMSVKTKCGEIYCQGFEEITINCTFCEMRLYEFSDFLIHLRNLHFSKNPLHVNEEEISYDTMKMEFKTEIMSDLESEKTNFDDQELNIRSNCSERQTEWCNFELVNENIVEEENVEGSKQKRKRRRKKQQSTEAEPTDSDENDFYMKCELNNSPQPKRLFECIQCKKSYLRKSALKVHLARAHAVTEIDVVCKECTMEFPNKRLHAMHQVQAHGGFKCPDCDKRFKQHYMLVNHLPYHTGERTFKCDFENCTKSFFNRRRLTTHIRSCHTGEKNYVCETCGYRCHAQNTLRVHVRKHTGEKPYACEVCEKRFVSHSSLSEHRATHRSDRPFVCDVCGASFARQKALYHHKPLHLSEKKFKCKICSSAYAQAAGLAGHMRKHKEEMF